MREKTREEDNEKEEDAIGIRFDTTIVVSRREKSIELCLTTKLRPWEKDRERNEVRRATTILPYVSAFP